MLPKINRLKKTKDIERVFREGRGFGEGFLFLKLAKNDLNAVRFAFIVGKKISNRASVRNKIKRIMRDAVQKRIDNIKYGFDAVIIAQTGAKENNFQKVESEVEKLFKKTKLFK